MLADPIAPSDTAPSPTSGPRRSLFLHSLALLAVLLGLAALVDNGHSAITDEGAVVAQVIGIDDGSWRLPLPFSETHPDLDPEGRFVPMENSDVVDGAYLPYAKHPAYPALLLPFWVVGGHLGLLVASSLGAWGAALAGALLSRRLGSPDEVTLAGRMVRVDLVTLWVLGLGTPLVFDATVVMAHGIAAAGVGFMVLAVLRCLRSEGRDAAVAALVAVALAVFVTLIRTEGLLAVGSLAAVLVALGLLQARRSRGSVILSRLAPLGVVLGAVGAGAYLLDGRLSALLIGADGVTPFHTAADGYDLVSGRAQALWASVLRPGEPASGAEAILVLLAALFLLLAVYLARRHRPVPVPLVVGLSGSAAALLVLRHAFGPGQVTGLLPAAPLVGAGLLALRGDHLRSPAARICAGMTVLTALGVLATSYSVGGAAEWGGRFYHVVLPLFVPLAVVGLLQALGELPDRAVSGVVLALVVAMGALSALWIRTNMDLRHTHARLVEATAAAAAATEPPADGGPPIVLSDPRGLGRVMWDHHGNVRFMRLAKVADLEVALDALERAEVGTVLLALSPKVDETAALGASWTVVRLHPPGLDTWRMMEVRQR